MNPHVEGGDAVLSEDFELWYRHEHPKVLGSLAMMCGDVNLAEDITAEAFARALERWDRVQLMESPAGWTHTVAVNCLRRRQRRAGLERRLLQRQRLEHERPPDRDPGLWRAVRDLPERMRQAVALRYVADLKEAEIADVLGISRGTVASTLHAARDRLADRLTTSTVGEGRSHG